MATPSFPTININLEDILGKVEDALKPVMAAFEEKFDFPAAETGTVEYDNLYIALIDTLRTKIADIEKSTELTFEQKVVSQTELYKIWAGVVS